MKLTSMMNHLIFYKTKNLYLGEVVKTKFTISKYINPMFSKTTKECVPYTPSRIIIAKRKESIYQELSTNQNYLSKDYYLKQFVNDHPWSDSIIEQDIFLPKRKVASDYNSSYISKAKIKKYIHIFEEKERQH